MIPGEGTGTMDIWCLCRALLDVNRAFCYSGPRTVVELRATNSSCTNLLGVLRRDGICCALDGVLLHVGVHGGQLNHILRHWLDHNSSSTTLRVECGLGRWAVFEFVNVNF